MKSQSNWKLVAGAGLMALVSYTASGQSSQTDPSSAGQAPSSQDAPAPAGPRGHWRGGMGSEREVEHLTHLLTLSPDQQKGVRSVLEQQGEQMRALRNKSQSASQSESTANETPETRRTQMEQIHNETNTKIAALLDDNQKKTFADWNAKRKAEMESRRQQGGPDGAGGPPPPPPNE